MPPSRFQAASGPFALCQRHTLGGLYAVPLRVGKAFASRPQVGVELVCSPPSGRLGSLPRKAKGPPSVARRRALVSGQTTNSNRASQGLKFLQQRKIPPAARP